MKVVLGQMDIWSEGHISFNIRADSLKVMQLCAKGFNIVSRFSKKEAHNQSLFSEKVREQQCSGGGGPWWMEDPAPLVGLRFSGYCCGC